MDIFFDLGIVKVFYLDYYRIIIIIYEIRVIVFFVFCKDFELLKN